MGCYYEINGLNLKGASTMNQIVSFREQDLNLVSNVLKIARFYIKGNPDLFQDPEHLLSEIEKGINIISSKTGNNNNIKGASNNTNICYEKKKQEVLKNIIEHFSIYR